MSAATPATPGAGHGRGAVGWMARNTVAANLLMATLLVGGVVASLFVPQEVFPEFDMDMISVRVDYPGASPEEVEEGIVLALEESIRGLDGIKKVTSSSGEGSGTVFAEIQLGEDPDEVTAEVKNAVDRVTSLPEDAERPIVSLMTNRREVITVALYGDQEEATLKELAESFREKLLAGDDVTQVALTGVRPVEIGVEVPLATLRRHGLTLDGIAQKIRQHSVQLPGGTLKTAAGEVLVRTDERRDTGRELAEVPILTDPSGAEVRLGELAAIEDGFSEVDQFATFNGKRAVGVQTFRVGDQTPMQIAESVKAAMEEFRRTVPGDVDLAVVSDWSELYRDRMDLLLRNAWFGLVLVFVTLALFLEMRLAFWVTLGIPVSFAGAFLLMPAWGGSLNMITLFAFIVTLGMVVDDAIVVGENFYELRQRGVPLLEAATRGATEVGLPVVFSVLTTLVAFAPLFFVPGVMGKFFWAVPAIVISVLSVSLVECLFVLPAHLGHEPGVPKKGALRVLLFPLGLLLLALRPVVWVFDHLRRFFSWGLERFIAKLYGPFLHGMLRRRYLSIAAALSVLVAILGLVAGGRVQSSFFPRIESDNVTATVLLPIGSPAARTEEVMDRIVAAAMEVMEEEGGYEKIGRGIYARLGSAAPGGGAVSQVRVQPGGHVASVEVRLKPLDVRGISSQRFADRWREAVGEVAGVDSLTFKSVIGGGGAPIDVQLSHKDPLALQDAARALAASLERYEGVTDIDPGFSEGKPRLDFELRPGAASLGLTSLDLARQVRGAFFGAEAFRQQRGRDELRVFVRLPESERRSEHDIESLVVMTPQGGEIPVGAAARVERDRAPTSIVRNEGRRVVSVTADVDRARANAEEVMAAVTKDVLPGLLERFPGLSWDLEGQQGDRKESIKALGIGLLVALLGIFALIAIPFRSYVQPIVVMSAIPFGFAGVVLGHALLGIELSLMSMMGAVALSGVVVNDSIVLVHAANLFRDGDPTHGVPPISPHDAVHAAGCRRMRPILLTSFTTFFGLAPMILETSVQARFLVPMAVSLGFGVMFSTFVTLLVVPCLYLVVEDVRHLLGYRRETDRTEPGPAAAASEALQV